MNFRELRNRLISSLWDYIGCPVILSNQVQPEAEPPFCIYTVTAPYIPDGGMGDYEISDVAEGVKISRMEMPSATFSFTFCSQNRTAEDGSAVNGEDEAWAFADKAISYFKHAGQDDFLAVGVAVVDVGQAQDRTTLLVDEAARRVGFDVQIRYTRIDERETASIEDLRDHNDDWYFILTDVTDPVCVTALCKWAESTEPTEAALGAGVEDHRKFYFGQTNDKEYVNEYGRSVVTYADNLAEWADAAWVGSVGPFWPESVTWKWKVPDGVSVADLRDSERDLLEENRVNFMTAEYKHEYMKNGICGDGNFIDNVLGADYITHQIRENLYEIFIANKKIAYTDDGFALVAAGVFAALNRAVELHIIATDPEDDTGVYTVVIPKRADATDEQARNRQMPDIKWSAQLEGAVHSVKVNGTLRVTLNG